MNNPVSLRSVNAEDSSMLLHWRNQPHVAEYMYTDHVISQTEHETWFQSALVNPSRRYWIAEFLGQNAGLVNLYDIDAHNKRAYWAFYIGELALQSRGIGGLIEY